MQSIVRFFKYNNAVPITLGVLFLGAGSAFAATNPEAIVSSQQQVVSVDNSYIVNLSLATFDPQMKVTSVTEDGGNYYVAYEYQTIVPVDYVWKPSTITKTMTVSKKELEGGDLGLFVSHQLSQIVGDQINSLASVQSQERTKGESLKVVATAYSGLIGKFLSTTEETFEGYTPVIQPKPDDTSQAAAVASTGGSGGTGTPPSGGGSGLMSLQVLSLNPSRIPVGASYIDLGALLIDPTAPNLGYHSFVNGVQMDPPNIDTSTTSVYTIEYRATDQAGNNLMVRRIVLVGNATDPGTEINTAGSVGPAPAPVVVPDPTPPPTPTPDPTPVTPPAPVDTSTSTPPVDTTPVVTQPASTTAATATPPVDTPTTTTP